MIVQNHDSEIEDAGGDDVTLQVNEAYPRREKMMITQQNEAYGVHSRDQPTIETSPNEAYHTHTGGALPNEIYDVCKD